MVISVSHSSCRFGIQFRMSRSLSRPLFRARSIASLSSSVRLSIPFYCLTATQPSSHFRALQTQARSQGLAQTEDIFLKLSNGLVQLRIYRPNRVASISHPPQSPPVAVLFFPSLPDKLGNNLNTDGEASDSTLISSFPDDRIGSVLCSVSDLPVIRICYRGGLQHPFPGPLFDCMAALDWVGAHIGYIIRPYALDAKGEEHGVPVSVEMSDLKRYMGPVRTQVRLAAYGTGFGGSLALSVALTECKTRKRYANPNQRSVVSTVGVQNPVVDWVDPDIESYSETAGRVTGKEDLETPAESDFSTLAADWNRNISPRSPVRELLFRNKTATFDSFASPLLFFRNATVDEVRSMPTQQQLAAPSVEKDGEESFEVFEDYSPRRGKSAPKVIRTFHKTRRTHKMFPPTLSDLRLPDMCIRITEKGEAVKGQVDEFVGLVRRSVRRDEGAFAQTLQDHDSASAAVAAPHEPVDEDTDEVDDTGVEKKSKDDTSSETSEAAVLWARKRIMYIIPPPPAPKMEAAGKKGKGKRKKAAAAPKKKKVNLMTDMTSQPDLEDGGGDRPAAGDGGESGGTTTTSGVDPELAHLVALGQWFGKKLRGQ